METTIQIIVYVIIVGAYGFKTWLSWLNYSNRHAPIPEVVQDVYDQKEYEKWLEYSMENHRFQQVVGLIDVIVFLLLLSTGLFVWLDDVSAMIVEVGHLQMLIFLGLYFLITYFVGLYPSYYHAFVIEEKYGFNKMTMKTFVTDQVKKLLLTIVLGGGVVYLIMVINDATDTMFFVYTWVALYAIIMFINLFYVRLIVPLFNKLTPLEDGELKDAINEFAESVGYEVAKISVIDASKRSSKLNAYFSGFGKMKRIVLYDTLIEKMTTEQIVAVLAHEIGHNKHKHVLWGLVQTGLVMAMYIGAFAVVLNVDAFSTAFGFEQAHFGFALILFMVLLQPIDIILGVILSSISRKHEFQADHYAATQFKDQPMVDALKVLSRENFANLTPHPLFVKMTYSHPPTAARIEAIKVGVERET